MDGLANGPFSLVGRPQWTVYSKYFTDNLNFCFFNKLIFTHLLMKTVKSYDAAQPQKNMDKILVRAQSVEFEKADGEDDPDRISDPDKVEVSPK